MAALAQNFLGCRGFRSLHLQGVVSKEKSAPESPETAAQKCRAARLCKMDCDCVGGGGGGFPFQRLRKNAP